MKQVYARNIQNAQNKSAQNIYKRYRTNM